jgi:hypothetical protein
MIVRQYGLDWPMPREVRLADDTLLATECRDLLCPSEDPWRIEVEPLAERIVPLSAGRAEQMFLERFRDLR